MLSLGHRYLVYDLCSLCPFFKLVSGRSSPLHARAVWSTGSPFSSGFAHQETNGSPKFPGYPRKHMPRSSTPVVSSTLALAHPGLLPSTSMTASAFPPILAVILCGKKIFPAGPRLYKFRGSITRPALLFPLASDFRYRIYPQGVLLTCWLDFD
jgi:hypothetical protein